jgi:phenylpyruvate tautomerase PptA (4-oxalocrotonate tautomerase family)
MSRNQERVLSDALVNDISQLMYTELQTNPESVHAVVSAMVNAYLTDDWVTFGEFATDIIEGYEDDVLLTLNMEIREDLENQNENNA